MKNYYKISEISKLYNIGPDSLRYYEQLGILKPKRDTNFWADGFGGRNPDSRIPAAGRRDEAGTDRLLYASAVYLIGSCESGCCFFDQDAI